MNKIRIFPCKICGTNVVTVGRGRAQKFCSEEHREEEARRYQRSKSAMTSRAHLDAIRLYNHKINELDAQITVLQARKITLMNIKDSMKHQWGLI